MRRKSVRYGIIYKSKSPVGANKSNLLKKRIHEREEGENKETQNTDKQTDREDRVGGYLKAQSLLTGY